MPLALRVILYIHLQTQQKLTKMKTQLSDFRFVFAGYGHYKVTYTSPITGKEYTAITSNMPLIDATKNADEPKQSDLNHLKRIVKAH